MRLKGRWKVGMWTICLMLIGAAQAAPVEKSLNAKLKKAEQKVSQASHHLTEINFSLRDLEREIKQIRKEIDELRSKEQKQRLKLQKQLISAYKSDISPSVIERLLSPHAKNADRLRTYYRYLNAQRLDEIKSLRETQARLKAKYEKYNLQRKKMNGQLDEKAEQTQALKEAQDEYQNTQNALDASPTSSGKNGLGKANHQYNPPISGKTLVKYGANLGGASVSHGIVLSGNVGEKVKAIADGKVASVGKLEGYGNAVMITHGDYISIYGFTQNIRVKRGDSVRQGDMLAEVGKGFEGKQTGLFFGIYHLGNPQNPTAWLR